MGLYGFKAKTKKGATKQGRIEATNEQEALNALSAAQ